MRCSSCHARFSADWAQPAPGGSSAPGAFVILALVFLAAAVALLVLGVPYAPWVCLAIAVFVAIQVPIAWHDCRRKAGLAEHGGGTCPKCGTENPVRLWSL